MYEKISEEEYKSLIFDSCNRIIQDKNMFIEEKKEKDKILLEIKFNEPEWYKELDDTLKFDIFTNLQRIFKKKLKNMIEIYDQSVTGEKIESPPKKKPKT